MPEGTNQTAERDSFLLDVIMLAQIAGGKERTKQEFLALATAAGFKGINYESCVFNMCIMEFFK